MEAIHTSPSYTLVGIEGWFSGDTFYTSGDNSLIGRSPGCQIQIEDPAVSKQHARLFHSEGKWFIEDLDSSNGTYINGRKINKPRRLRPHDKIKLGTHSFRFYPGTPDQIPPPIRIKLQKWIWIFVLLVFLGVIAAICISTGILG